MYLSEKQPQRYYEGIGRKNQVLKVNEVGRSRSIGNSEFERRELLYLSQALVPARDFDSENVKKTRRSIFTIGNACSSV